MLQGSWIRWTKADYSRLKFIRVLFVDAKLGYASIDECDLPPVTRRLLQRRSMSMSR